MEPRIDVPRIDIKIKDDQAIVRKVLHHPPRRYALTTNGQWAFVPEGQAYPEQCILPVIKHNPSVTPQRV